MFEVLVGCIQRVLLGLAVNGLRNEALSSRKARRIQTLSVELADLHKHYFFNCDINILWVRLLFNLLPESDLNAQRWKRLILSLCSLRKYFETKLRSFVDSTIPHHLVQGAILCQHILSQCGFAAVTAHAGFPLILIECTGQICHNKTRWESGHYNNRANCNY